MVRAILVEMTTPFRMRPRIDTLPVNGHFLSMYVPCKDNTVYNLLLSNAVATPATLQGKPRDQGARMRSPFPSSAGPVDLTSAADLGVLKPRPTDRTNRSEPFCFLASER